MLSNEEKIKYQRHFSLPDFGEEGQIKLKNANVLIVGCGGLGSPVSLYLTAAGIGTIGLADFDTVSTTNLQRQILFTEKHEGLRKAEIAKKRLNKLNNHCNLKAYTQKLDSQNALEIIQEYDLVIDCTDNFPTRYLINDACILLKKPFIYGSIYQYEGQVSVFNYQGGPNYRDLYPNPPSIDAIPNCEIGGVLGTLPGIIGSIQANEAIKIISGIGNPLSQKLFIFDSLEIRSTIIDIQSVEKSAEITELIDYELFCNPKNITMVNEITVQELDQMMKNKEDFQLIDVREPHEVEISTLNGELMPLGDIPNHIDNVSKDKKVIVHCRSGARSAQAIQFLQSKGSFDNLYNLKGGILAWADEIDTSMSKY